MPKSKTAIRWRRSGFGNAISTGWSGSHERNFETRRGVADEEDVAVSAFDSFYRGAEEGRFPELEDRDGLWQVLVMITARKAANQMKHDFRQKRGGGQVRGESAFLANLSDEERRGIDQVVGTEPTPEFADQVSQQCQELLESLDDDTLRDVAIWKMEGYTNDELAERKDSHDRTQTSRHS